jgi:hypothetical protein
MSDADVESWRGDPCLLGALEDEATDIERRLCQLANQTRRWREVVVLGLAYALLCEARP